MSVCMWCKYWDQAKIVPTVDRVCMLCKYWDWGKQVSTIDREYVGGLNTGIRFLL